ncbi:MAG: glycosyltransferase family 4 protein [bacterium]
MKVLFLTPEVPYPPLGGSKTKSYNLIRQLSERCEVHLYTFATPEDEKNLDKLKPWCGSIETVGMGRGGKGALGKLKRLASPTPDYMAAFISAEMLDRVREAVATGAFDVLHVETIFMGIYGLRTEGEKNARPFRVLAPNDCISEYYRLHSAVLRPSARKVFMRAQYHKVKAMERRLYGRYDACIFVTERDLRTAERRAGALPNASVVPMGVDTVYFSPGDETATERPSAVFTGYMSYVFNDDAAAYFIREAYPLIKKKIPGFRIFFVGVAPSGRLKKFGERDGDVVVTGYVPDVRPYVRRAWVYVSPLRYGLGMKDKILEAFSMGKAVVATGASCNGIEAMDGREFVLADGAGEIAERTVSLLENAEARSALGANARRLVEEKYTWKRAAEEMEKIYGKSQNNTLGNRVVPGGLRTGGPGRVK